MGHHAKALQDYNKAIELDPIDSLAYNYRGNLYNSTGQSDKALLDYNKAIELDPNLFTTHNLKDAEKALSDYNKAIELNPNDSLAYNKRGHVYQSMG